MHRRVIGVRWSRVIQELSYVSAMTIREKTTRDDGDNDDDVAVISFMIQQE